MKHIFPAVALAVLLLTFVPMPKRVRPEGPVATALASASAEDRATIRGIYRALADITERDAGKVIKTTAVWRAIHSDALRLAVGGSSLVGKYIGLDNAVEQVMAANFSLDNVAIDPAMTARIVAACRAVEQQCD